MKVSCLFNTYYFMKIKKPSFTQHLDKKLSRRLKMYLILSFVMFGIFIYEVIITHYTLWYGLLFFVGSSILGFFVARMFHISWDEDNEIVTSRMDKIWGIILVGYMIFSFSRHYLLTEYVPKTFILPITFAIVSGVMIGRYIGMRNKVHRVLKGQDII